MAKKYVRLSVTQETKDLIVNQCRKEFLKNYPNMRGVFLSEDFLVDRVGKYYLK